MPQEDLFAALGTSETSVTEVCEDVWLLKNYLGGQISDWLEELRQVVRLAPMRQMQTPTGKKMSVRTSSCGDWGWVGGIGGYRYEARQPETDTPWPALPSLVAPFISLLSRDLESRGCHLVTGFEPDSGLLNLYGPGARMGMHQDRDEQSFNDPIVSLSFGLPVTFLMGGFERSGPTLKILLEHGDVLVFGGASRLRYHGVRALQPGLHGELGEQRLNLTLRRAGGNRQ